MWGTVVLVLVIIASLPLWWLLQLTGLPDIGDPFDVAAFRSFTIPADRNAFVLYSQAAELLKPNSQYLATASTRVDQLARWSTAAPELASGLKKIATRWLFTVRAPSGPMPST